MAKFSIDISSIDNAVATLGEAIRRAEIRQQKAGRESNVHSLHLAIHGKGFADERGCPIGARGKSPKGLAETRDAFVALAGFEKFGGTVKRAWTLLQAFRTDERTKEMSPAELADFLHAEGIETRTDAEKAFIPKEAKGFWTKVAEMAATEGFTSETEFAEGALKSSEFRKVLAAKVADAEAKAKANAEKAEARKAEKSAKAEARKAEKALAKARKLLEDAGIDASELAA